MKNIQCGNIGNLNKQYHSVSMDAHIPWKQVERTLCTSLADINHLTVQHSNIGCCPSKKTSYSNIKRSTRRILQNGNDAISTGYCSQLWELNTNNMIITVFNKSLNSKRRFEVQGINWFCSFIDNFTIKCLMPYINPTIGCIDPQ